MPALLLPIIISMAAKKGNHVDDLDKSFMVDFLR
jgi:hypothetical protein